MADFQHVNCMIVRIWDRKSRELHAMLGLKFLLRQLPQLLSGSCALDECCCLGRARTDHSRGETNRSGWGGRVQS